MTRPYSTAYPSRQRVGDSSVKKSMVNAASTKQSKSVFMANFCNSAQIPVRVLGISGVLNHRKLRKTKKNFGNAKMNLLIVQLKSVS